MTTQQLIDLITQKITRQGNSDRITAIEMREVLIEIVNSVASTYSTKHNPITTGASEHSDNTPLGDENSEIIYKIFNSLTLQDFFTMNDYGNGRFHQKLFVQDAVENESPVTLKQLIESITPTIRNSSSVRKWKHASKNEGGDGEYLIYVDYVGGDFKLNEGTTIVGHKITFKNLSNATSTLSADDGELYLPNYIDNYTFCILSPKASVTLLFISNNRTIVISSQGTINFQNN